MKEESIQVAQAAMRGDIGQTRMAQAPRLYLTGIIASGPKPGGIHAAPQAAPISRKIEIASASPMPSTPRPAVRPEPIVVPPPRPVEAPSSTGEQFAEPERHAVPRSAWPSLIASAHAETEDTVLPTKRPAPPAVQSGRIFVQAGMFAVADNAHRLRARFAGLASTEVVRVTANGTPLYRVRLGPMASEAEARRLLEKLAASGISDARVIGD